MTARSRLSLYFLHLIGNGVLLLLGYYWLGMGEPDTLHLAFSACVILLFVAAAIWLHGTALVLFRPGSEARLLRAAVKTLRHILPLFVLAAVLVGVYLALSHFYDSFGHEAFTIGSYSTMKLRRPVAPENVLKAFHVFIWVIEWIVVPVLALPLASDIAEKGWAGFRLAAFRRSSNIQYCLQAAFLVIAAIHFPVHLYEWIPKMPNFWMEMVSVVVRLGLGYLLFTAGFLGAEFVTSAGMPRATQAKTAASP